MVVGSGTGALAALMTLKMSVLSMCLLKSVAMP
jgi:hypothetical protein